MENIVDRSFTHAPTLDTVARKTLARLRREQLKTDPRARSSTAEPNASALPLGLPKKGASIKARD